MSIAKRAAFGTGYTIAALIVSNILAYLFRMYLTRTLSVQDYGLFYAVFNFIILFLFFRDMGLNSALAKYIPEYRIRKDPGGLKAMMAAVLSIQAVTSALLCLVLYLTSDVLADHYFKDQAAKGLIIVFIGYVLLSVLFRFLKGAFIGFKSFLFGAFLEPFNNLAVLAGTVFFFSYGFGVVAPALAYIVSILLTIAVSTPVLLSLYNPFREKMRGFKPAVREAWMFGLPMVVASLGGQIIGYMDTVMLTFFTDLQTVGIYNVILPSAMLFLIFGRGITTVMVPLISELNAKKNEKAIADGVSLLYIFSLVLPLPLISAVMAFPDFFLLLFFGKEYVVGSVAFQILLGGVLFYIVSQINESVLIGLGRPRMVTRATLVAAGLNILLNLLFIPLLGITGAAIATSASFICMLIMTTRNIRGLLRMSSPLKKWSLTLVSGSFYVLTLIIVSRALSFSPWAEVALSVTAGIAVYAASIFGLKVVGIEEIRQHLKMLLRRS